LCPVVALVVAPASANFIQHIVGGKMATPATALVASALGQGKQVLVLPAMHDSLANSPFYKRNLQTLTELANVTVLRGRQEEGKQKFPDPEILSSEVAHLCNTGRRPKEPILITSGTTRGYIDEIRYVSNYSSGSLGKAVAHELFRQGFRTTIVAGPAEHQAELYTRKTDVKTTREMLDACLDATANSRLLGAIFCASVLDFEPTQRLPGKIPSSSSELTVTMKPNEKIIARVNVSGPVKIGFKLGIDFGQTEAETIAREYMQKYNLTALIANDFRRVNASEHHAWAVTRDGHVQECKSKQEIATWIARCFEQSLASHS